MGSGLGIELPGGSFVGSLDAGDARDLIAAGRATRFAAGVAILREGAAADRVVAIVAGRVKVASLTEDGREVFLALRGPGELVGELSTLDGRPRSASVVAIDEVDARVLTAAAFRTWLRTHPDAALRLLEMLSRRLREADAKLREFTAYDSAGRVARRLLELAEQHGVAGEGGSVRIDLPLTQEDLAAWTGSSREAVSKSLRLFRGLGWVATRRRGTTVLDLGALRRRAT